MKRWLKHIKQRVFRLENEILVPFLLIEIVVIVGIFLISYYHGEEQNYLVVGAIAALLLVSQVSIFIAHSISRPIRKMSKTCEAIRKDQGSYRSYHFPEARREDEIGELARTFEELLKTMDNYTKMEYTSRMSASLAHEIKNPIAGIRSGIQLLKGRVEKEGDKLLCDSMIHEIDRVNTLIMNLFTLSVRKETPKEKVNLVRVINELSLIYQKEMESRGILLTTDMEDGLTAWVNEHELRQILQNLISNSRKAMVTGREGRIHIRGCTDLNHSVLIVEDNGKGMSEEELANAQEPFYTKNINGVGLGLAIVKKLTEQNDASITMESTVGVGTRVLLRLQREAVDGTNTGS